MHRPWVGSSVAALLALALLAGCGGNAAQTTPQGSEDVVSDPAGFNLPAPSEIHLASDAGTSPFKYGEEYEQGLPNWRVATSRSEHSLVFSTTTTGWPENVAYAMYFLSLPEYDYEPVVKVEASKTYNVWIGFANYGANRWDLERLSSAAHGNQFDPNSHVSNGGLLIAIVAMNTDPVDYLVAVDWLVAGDTTKPYVEDVQPKIMMTGDHAQFDAWLEYSACDTYSWDFGGGVTPNLSDAPNPEVTALASGIYSGTLTTVNAAGSAVYEFSYKVTAVNIVPPMHLQAIPEKTSAVVNEPIRVTIRCGEFPEQEPMKYCIVTLLVSEHVSYIPNSFNVGSPGGAQEEVDGIWDHLSPPVTGFILGSDSWRKFFPATIPGFVEMDTGVVPADNGNTTSSGEIFNLELSFNQPGEYELHFSPNDSRLNTYYGYNGTDNILEFEWVDISNDVAPAITVTE